MMSAKNISIATLQIVGGRPSLDLANTVAARHNRWGPDLLVDYSALVQWAERTGILHEGEIRQLKVLAAADPTGAQAALNQARELRETIYRVFSAVAARSEPDQSDLGALEAVSRQARVRQRLRVLPDGRFGWLWDPVDDLDEISVRVSDDATDLLTDRNRLTRVKECFGRNCGWLFLDTSRGGRRRWCTDAECGTLDRVTRHRARKRNPSSSDQARRG